MECNAASIYRIIPFILTDGGIYRREIYFTSTDIALIERRVALEAFGYGGYVIKRHGYVVKLRGRRYVECLITAMPGLTCKKHKDCPISLHPYYADNELARSPLIIKSYKDPSVLDPFF